MPSLINQIGQIYDDTYRQTFEYNNELGSVKNQLKSRLPRVSKTLAPQVNVMGEELKRVSDGTLNKAFNVFLNPANIKENTNNRAAKEIYRVYETTGEKSIIPQVAPYYAGSGDNKIYLSSDERADWQKTSGQTASDIIEQIMVNKSYKNMTDINKADILNDVVLYAKNVANKEVLGLDISDTYKKAYEADKKGISVSTFLLVNASKDANNNGSVTQTELKLAIDNSGLTKPQKAQLWETMKSKTWKIENPFS